MRIEELDVSAISKEEASFLADAYLDHRFDILGSGWVKNSYDAAAAGFEGAHFEHNIYFDYYDVYGNWLRKIVQKKQYRMSKHVWGEMSRITYDHEGIDWQKDVKSGFRWAAKDWYKDQTIKSHGEHGVDIKVPFELSRLQHLPQMAILALVLPERKTELLNEFLCQTIDFIAANPPRYGVCWTSSMEVGIRAANMLIAFDLFSQLDTEKVININFQTHIADSIYSHGMHLVKNLEYKESITNNHYLSNICGLLFVSSYLDGYPFVDSWLAFSIQELISEIDKQVLDDGGVFESSTSYQRLTGEMIVYAIALLKGLPNKKLEYLRLFDSKDWKGNKGLNPVESQKYTIRSGIQLEEETLDKVGRMIELSEKLTKTNGEIAQVGDNDSGRFFNLSPVGSLMSFADAKRKYQNINGPDELYSKLHFDQNALDHRPFVSAGSGLFEQIGRQSSYPLERSFVKSLTKNRELTYKPFGNAHSYSDNNLDLEFTTKSILQDEIPKGGSLKDELEILPYAEFGACVIRSKRIHMTIACGNKHVRQYWTHTHNDKLSFELNVDGIDLIVHPGTYCYTSVPELRNAFRSVESYNSIIVEGKEQNDWVEGVEGVFRTEARTECTLLETTPNSIKLMVTYKGITHVRLISINDDSIEIHDSCNEKFNIDFNRHRMYSNGYGKRLN
ncbi:MAG: alginate lyase family protein [Flavobacteriales bacterium]|nr:alginate lyase family protein [Flavobacteriales bacterium]